MRTSKEAQGTLATSSRDVAFNLPSDFGGPECNGTYEQQHSNTIALLSLLSAGIINGIRGMDERRI
jgi:hypothetical protein